MADLYLLFRTTNRRTETAAQHGQDDQGSRSNHVLDLVVHRWAEDYETCPFTPTERTAFFLVKVTDIPDLRKQGVLAAIYKKDAIYEEGIVKDLLRPKLRGLAGPSNNFVDAVDHLKSVWPKGKRIIDEYFNNTTEQPENRIPEIPVATFRELLWDKAQGRPVTEEELGLTESRLGPR